MDRKKLQRLGKRLFKALVWSVVSMGLVQIGYEWATFYIPPGVAMNGIVWLQEMIGVVVLAIGLWVTAEKLEGLKVVLGALISLAIVTPWFVYVWYPDVYPWTWHWLLSDHHPVPQSVRGLIEFAVGYGVYRYLGSRM